MTDQGNFRALAPEYRTSRTAREVCRTTLSGTPRARLAALFLRFLHDRSGSYTIVAGLTMPALIGFAGLSTEYGLWMYSHQAMLSAADSGAVSAAAAGNSFSAEADAVIGSYGFVAGVNGVTVTVNQPPQSGNYMTRPGAVEVIVQQQQPRLFSGIYDATPVTIRARAVAVRTGGSACVLALDRTASAAVSAQGSASVSLQGCSLYDNSNDSSALSVGGSATLSTTFVGVVGGVFGSNDITATNGIRTGMSPIADPYADVSPPAFSGCSQNNFAAKSTVTIGPGVYCGGMKLNAGAYVTLDPGVYYLDQGSLDVSGGATLIGAGVTLVFTSSTGKNWATATINGNATVNLTAPDSGPTAGIVAFGDRNMPVGTTFKLTGGASQYFGGAIYAPKGAVSFIGGSSTGDGCTQLIGDTISFAGNSNLQTNCAAYGTKAIASALATLVE